jgi:hypothetical protein
MILPPFMLVLFFIPPTQEKIVKKKLWIVGIYPFVYSVFSIIRGAFSNPEFYAYPFYRPDFFWKMFFKGQEIELVSAYLLMLPMLLIGISIFVLIALVLTLIYNRICDKMSK